MPKEASRHRTPPSTCDDTKTFLKAGERLSRSGRYDLKRLKEAMLLRIANDAPLGPEWLDHRNCSRNESAAPSWAQAPGWLTTSFEGDPVPAQ